MGEYCKVGFNTTDDMKFLFKENTEELDKNKVDMFEEIRRLSQILHGIKVLNRDLLKILTDNNSVCMCGGLSFDKLLPKELCKEYSSWVMEKSTNEIVEHNVKSLSEEINKEIIKEIINGKYGN